MELSHWTEAQQQQLFEEYFGSGPATCPVCSEEVEMIMSHLGRTVTLLVYCSACSNKATITRELPRQGPLHKAAA